MAPFLVAARQPKRMAKKIAAMRLFFMLRNKKLITKRPCLAPAGQPVRMRVKNSALHYFLLLRNKKHLILMAPFLAAVAATETDSRKNSRIAAIFYYSAFI